MNLEEIWKTHKEELTHFALSKVKQEDVVQDILQEVYIKAQTKWNSLKDESKVRPWLFSVTRNTITDYFRSKKTITLEESHLNSDDFLEEQPSNKHTEKDCLRGIIKNLPKKYRDPLFLSDIKGMKQQEIANQLNLTLPTVKSQIQRARKMIVKGYMDCCDYTLNENGHLVGEVKEKENCKVCK